MEKTVDRVLRGSMSLCSTWQADAYDRVAGRLSCGPRHSPFCAIWRKLTAGSCRAGAVSDGVARCGRLR